MIDWKKAYTIRSHVEELERQLWSCFYENFDSAGYPGSKVPKIKKVIKKMRDTLKKLDKALNKNET